LRCDSPVNNYQCRKKARVRVVVRISMYDEPSYTRTFSFCWEHYLMHENVARARPSFQVVSATIIQ